MLVLLSNKKMKYLDSVIPIVMVELFQKLYGVGTNRVTGVSPLGLISNLSPESNMNFEEDT